MTETDRIIFVYQLKRKPYTSKCVHIEDDHYGIDKRYRHIATIDPAVWLEGLLNSNDKNNQIEELYE